MSRDDELSTGLTAALVLFNKDPRRLRVDCCEAPHWDADQLQFAKNVGACRSVIHPHQKRLQGVIVS